MTTPSTRTLGKDDWMTPAAVFEPVHRIVRFTGDACAADASQAKVANFISPEMDALSMPWGCLGPRAWCNPPYGRSVEDWFQHATNQVANRSVETVCLCVYANTDTTYWHRWVAGNWWCHLVIFLRPRVRFMRPDGGKAVGAPKGSALVFLRSLERMGTEPIHRYADWTRPGWAADVLPAPFVPMVRVDPGTTAE